MTSTQQPPHLISALEQLDEQLEHTEPDVSEAPARRQRGLAVEVFLEGADPYVVRINNRDRIAYEKTAARHKEWPEGTSFVMTYLTWAAARRVERTSLTFDQWQTALEDWDKIADEPADPTR